MASCADCPHRSVDVARAPFLYDGPLGRAIRGMKFSGWHALGRHLAGAMAEVAGDLRADVLTWVPLSRRRRRRRGFDQAEVLARALKPRLGLPLDRLLVRTRDTRAQARQTAADRRRALAGAFTVLKPVVGDVLLVDDVLTTGSTAAACSEELKEAGAARVFLLTAARSLRGPIPARCLGLEPGRPSGYH